MAASKQVCSKELLAGLEKVTGSIGSSFENIYIYIYFFLSFFLSFFNSRKEIEELHVPIRKVQSEGRGWVVPFRCL